MYEKRPTQRDIKECQKLYTKTYTYGKRPLDRDNTCMKRDLYKETSQMKRDLYKETPQMKKTNIQRHTRMERDISI